MPFVPAASSRHHRCPRYPVYSTPADVRGPPRATVTASRRPPLAFPRLRHAALPSGGVRGSLARSYSLRRCFVYVLPREAHVGNVPVSTLPRTFRFIFLYLTSVRTPADQWHAALYSIARTCANTPEANPQRSHGAHACTPAQSGNAGLPDTRYPWLCSVLCSISLCSVGRPHAYVAHRVADAGEDPRTSLPRNRHAGNTVLTRAAADPWARAPGPGTRSQDIAEFAGCVRAANLREGVCRLP